ncbi:MAG: hypothetical protein ABI432_09790 [Flavobacteriales bacterium]
MTVQYRRAQALRRPMAGRLNAVTHSPKSLEWGSSAGRFEGLGPDLVEGVRRIKSQVGTPPRSFDHISTRTFPSGIIFNTYKVAGELKAGGDVSA